MLQSVFPARFPSRAASPTLVVFPENPVPLAEVSTPTAGSSTVGGSSSPPVRPIAAPAPSPSVTVGEIIRLSLSSAEEQGNRDSQDASSSADGRWVAFSSRAKNLVPGDSNYVQDVFVRDRESGETSRISVASDGREAYADSGKPSISGDGRFVAFESKAKNLVPGDTNKKPDVFVHNRDTGETVRLSIASRRRASEWWKRGSRDQRGRSLRRFRVQSFQSLSRRARTGKSRSSSTTGTRVRRPW